MTKNLINLENEIKIAGVCIRTTNVSLSTSSKMQEVFNELFSLNIPDLSEDAKLYIAYFNYAPGFENDIMNSEFDILVGFEVDSFDNLDSNIRTVVLSKGKYQKFTTETGDLVDVVFKAWGKIWEDSELTASRSYVTDFEVHSNLDEIGSAEIYLGIK